jgi:hypothetical protein
MQSPIGVDGNGNVTTTVPEFGRARRAGKRKKGLDEEECTPRREAYLAVLDSEKGAIAEVLLSGAGTRDGWRRFFALR